MDNETQPDENTGVLHLRDFDAAEKPTVMTVNKYKSLRRLVECWKQHGHDKIVNMNASKWVRPKTDPQNWSKLKRLHAHIDKKMIKMCGSYQNAEAKGEVGGILLAKLEAAQWLDVNERGNQTLSKYELELANKTSKKRKTSQI